MQIVRPSDREQACTAAVINRWRSDRFEQVTQTLDSLEAVKSFVQAIGDFTPIRTACFRFWRSWAAGSDCLLEIASYPREASAEFGEVRKIRLRNMDRLTFERVLPINVLAEIETSTELGQYLSESVRHGLLQTAFVVIVKGVEGLGLFIGDCETDTGTWSQEFELAKGAMQLMGQSLYLAIERVAAKPREVLTPRERQCLMLAARGLTGKHIARELGLSDQTVTFYLSRIRMKLSVANTTEAVAHAFKHRLL